MRQASLFVIALGLCTVFGVTAGVAQSHPGVPAGAAAQAAAAAAQAAAMQQAGGMPAATFKPSLLSEEKLKGFFSAVEEYRALEGKSAALPAAPSQPEAFARGMQFSGEAQEILTRNGFSDPAEFQSVAFNAAMAYGVLKQGGTAAVAAKMAEAKANQEKAIAQLEQQLGPEQARALAAQMAGGLAVAESMQDVPEENVTLIERYREQMEALDRY